MTVVPEEGLELSAGMSPEEKTQSAVVPETVPGERISEGQTQTQPDASEIEGEKNVKPEPDLSEIQEYTESIQSELVFPVEHPAEYADSVKNLSSESFVEIQEHGMEEGTAEKSPVPPDPEKSREVSDDPADSISGPVPPEVR